MFKLIIAIIRDSDSTAVLDALVTASFRATRVASSGGFMRQGNTTLIIGVEAEKVDDALIIIRGACGPAPADGSHRATVFVLNTVRYEQI
ncbi:MAG TPA: cyclic-di-AMP receptor [Anaerolineales bacterium]|nr:cyclic-di-AMP receptor [Anaerolineales bacterium]